MALVHWAKEAPARAATMAIDAYGSHRGARQRQNAGVRG